MSIEIHILDNIPNHICELRKEEMLDENDLKFLSKIDSVSNFLN